MEKEFESLETLSNEIRYKKEFIGNDTYRLYIKKNEIESLEKYLTELKAIKEAKPNEALKFVNLLLNARLSDKHFINVANDETWLELSNIKLYILKAQEQEEVLKEIIKLIDDLEPTFNRKGVSSDTDILGTIIKDYFYNNASDLLKRVLR